MSAPALSRVEHALLEILESYQGDEVPGRELRGLLKSRGFRRTAPALVFTMLRLQDKGLVSCYEEVRGIDGVELREWYYRSREA